MVAASEKWSLPLGKPPSFSTIIAIIIILFSPSLSKSSLPPLSFYLSLCFSLSLFLSSFFLLLPTCLAVVLCESLMRCLSPESRLTLLAPASRSRRVQQRFENYKEYQLKHSKLGHVPMCACDRCSARCGYVHGLFLMGACVEVYEYSI